VRGLLGRLGVRGGAVVGIVVLVLGIVVIARLAGASPNTQSYSSGTQPNPTIDPTAGDDGVVGDGVPLPTQTATSTVPAAVLSPYPDDGEVTAAATAFAKAWLRRDLSARAWHSGIAPLVTESVAQSLDGVDPSSVPANRILGGPKILKREDLFARVGVSLDTGTLLLELSKHDKRWLVESVDWELA
jgi:hypothetical protein